MAPRASGPRLVGRDEARKILAQSQISWLRQKADVRQWAVSELTRHREAENRAGLFRRTRQLIVAGTELSGDFLGLCAELRPAFLGGFADLRSCGRGQHALFRSCDLFAVELLNAFAAARTPLN